MELRLSSASHTRDVTRIAGSARRASTFLKALAHESRLVMLCVLAEGEKSVTELTDLLDLRQPTVSQQLARLRAEKLVATRRNGKTIYYRLANAEVRKVMGALYDVFCRKKR